MPTGTPDWAGQRQAHGTEQMLAPVTDVIAQGQSVTHTIPVVRPGYIVELHAWNSTDGVTQLPFSVLVTWQDAATGNGLDRQQWNAYAGTVAGPHFIDGSGPTKGGIMVVKITNNAASAVSLTVFTIIDQTSAAYARHDWRTDDVFSFNPTGWTQPHHNMISGILAADNNVSVAAGQTLQRILPLYCGRVHIHMDGNVTAGNQLEFFITVPSDPNFTSAPDVYDELIPTSLAVDAELWLPRSQCVLNLHNNRATTAVVTDFAVTMAEY